MKGCGIDLKRVRRKRKRSGDGLNLIHKMARKAGSVSKENIVCANIVCVFIDNKMDDKYAYYASQAVYGSGVHHEYLTNEGYAVDNDFTNHNTKTYVKDGKALVAYKGTNPLNIVDLDADAAIAIGTQRRNPEFKKASSIAQRVKEKYGNVTTTGHSLGGTKAIESANDAGGKAVVFNPGTGLVKLKTGNHKVYGKSQDPISTRIDGNNVVWTDGGHSLDEYKRMFEPRVTGSAAKYSYKQKTNVGGGVSKKRGWSVY